jgi:hypothetical protein
MEGVGRLVRAAIGQLRTARCQAVRPLSDDPGRRYHDASRLAARPQAAARLSVSHRSVVTTGQDSFSVIVDEGSAA